MTLEVKNLKVEYKELVAVSNINFSIEESKITSIIGANGVGKSSIIKGLMGIVTPTRGEVVYKGNNLLKTPPNKMNKIGISLCPEGRQLFPDMTVQENLEMGAFSRKDKYITKDLEEVYEQFTILSQRKNQKASTLSGGEQELLAIARSLMSNPDLLILDEPSWGLAPVMINEVVEIIKSINKKGTTILLIEQNANIALKISDYAYVLTSNGFAIEGSGEDLLNNEEVRNVYLGT